MTDAEKIQLLEAKVDKLRDMIREDKLYQELRESQREQAKMASAIGRAMVHYEFTSELHPDWETAAGNMYHILKEVATWNNE